MKTEGSLPHLQQPATCPYLEPDRSSPCPHPTSLRSILILSPIFDWVFQVDNYTHTHTHTHTHIYIYDKQFLNKEYSKWRFLYKLTELPISTNQKMFQ